ncbi:come operon protein 2 [Heliomicrobium modesticaldum Ice1]|uniref:Come operon protein 2 n=1 Tax=Heliobacterium modesticaldum (strain ATCC 51547 / Ice1) TaxID=498761 RepID=B0TI62_HELMI|nr:cytidine/deoxycytidylate deaminase family protein [Heliomicrobium modesticaldum]ABZ83482.1 come operon protein 2 [Heliomicrobium modesticaldum Ice1]
MRKDWDSYFIDIAFAVSSRSTCPRRSVGAVIVKDKRIKGTGYNGSPAGLPHCTDAGCCMWNNHCVRTIHAEVNAIMECSPEERKGATIYVTDRPCAECAKVIISSGIRRVVFARDYHTEQDWFKMAPWIEVRHLPRQKGIDEAPTA